MNRTRDDLDIWNIYKSFWGNVLPPVLNIKTFYAWITIFFPASYLPLQAIGARGVANFKEASSGGPARWVLPWWWFFSLGPCLIVAKWSIDGKQGGVAAAPDVEGHIWEKVVLKWLNRRIRDHVLSFSSCAIHWEEMKFNQFIGKCYSGGV